MFGRRGARVCQPSPGEESDNAACRAWGANVTVPGMTRDQILAFSVIAAMMAMFVWGRLRYDLVAGLALLAAMVVGVVPFDKAFSGFSNDILVVVGAALLVSAAVTRSRLMDGFLQALGPRLSSVRAQLVLLVTTVTVLSAFVKNIGAL